MGFHKLRPVRCLWAVPQEHPDEVEKLGINDILTTVTSFFRDPESFSILQQVVFPAICENKSPDAPSGSG
jgi:two-component system CheB/CheR fusion protein